MRKYFYILILLFVLLLSSCQSATPEPTVVIATEEATQEAVVEVTEEPVATETAIADQCVQCHTDKEQLITTAKLEVVVESESSGVG